MAIQRSSRGVESYPTGVDVPGPSHDGAVERRSSERGGVLADPRRLARALGWLSIGLGVAQVAAPRAFARVVGTRSRPFLFRLLGAREIASGLGVLTVARPAGPMWARVAGDALDLGLLAAALNGRRPRRGRLGAAATSVIGVTALDALSAWRLSREPRLEAGGGIRVRHAVVIDKSPLELYGFWRDLQKLPLVMRHLKSVRQIDDRRSRWVAAAPAGATVEWDAEIVEDRPGELLAWRSAGGSDVDNAGSVRFAAAPGDRGTLLTVELSYMPPAGVAGATVAKLFGDAPGRQLQDDLRRFKQVMETGEVPTTSGQPSGRVRTGR